MFTCPQAKDSERTPMLCSVFFNGPVRVKIKAYAIKACRPLFEQNCGRRRNTMHLKNEKLRCE